MEENNFIISIVIPTKNRQEYAFKTIKQILLIKDKDIQVVVQDNSDDNRLENMLESFKSDKRLQYNYYSGILSFVDNFGSAVSSAKGEYICIIGDDDGINHEILETARWAKKNKIDAIKPTINSIYIWPDTGIISRDDRANSGYMTISKISSGYKFVNTDNELKKLLRNGCQRYLDLEMVKLYHGLVKREKLEQVKSVTGKYFGGLSPDIYGAVSLSVLIPKVLCIDYPLTISGICKKSGSADSVTGKHTGRYEDAPHLKGQSKYEWSKEVPKFYSVETIWADSAIAAIKDMRQEQQLENFRLDVLATHCIINYREYSNLVKKHYYKRMEEMKISKRKALINLYKSYIIIPTLNFGRKVKNRLTRRKGDLIKIYGVEDIAQAHEELQKYLKKNDLSIEKAINKIEREIINKGDIV